MNFTLLPLDYKQKSGRLAFLGQILSIHKKMALNILFCAFINFSLYFSFWLEAIKEPITITIMCHLHSCLVLRLGLVLRKNLQHTN